MQRGEEKDLSLLAEVARITRSNWRSLLTWGKSARYLFNFSF